MFIKHDDPFNSDSLSPENQSELDVDIEIGTKSVELTEAMQYDDIVPENASFESGQGTRQVSIHLVLLSVAYHYR